MNADEQRLPNEIGGYAIQRLLGSGGMASVYAALQKRPRRTVAVKVMRGTASTDTAIRRFRREIEFLGRLRHPYIAQIYDAGLHDEGGVSVPYFVMEYVPRARTILAFADERDLSERERLKLFVKVCAAVEHGHRNKIIHRDLKPANILIDESGDPKIIDFGVARAAEREVTSHTMQTEAGRIVGTIQYMAPEQLEPTKQDIDRRCDVYSLGVLLFRLLTGAPTHDVKGLPFFTAVQVIREDDPPRPSSIKPELKGDLETIILKALAKDRTRRYRTAGSLGRDLLRYLSAKPIHAREASALYRARLLLQRRKVEVRAAAVLAVVVLAAVAIIVYQRMTLTAGDETTPPAVAVDTAAPGNGSAGPGPGPGPGPGRDPDAEDGVDAGSSDALNSLEPPEPVVLSVPWQQTTQITFDPTGTFIAAASAAGHVGWCDLETGQWVRARREHEEAVTQLVYSHDGNVLVSASDDGSLSVLDTRKGTRRRIIRHEAGRVIALTVGPDAAQIAFAADDLTVRVLDAEGRERTSLRGSRGAFHQLAFAPDGTLLAGGAERGDIYLWDLVKGERRHRLAGLRGTPGMLKFTADGARILAVTERGTGREWKVGPGTARLDFEAAARHIDTMALDATGQWLIMATSTGLQLRNISTGVRTRPDPALVTLGEIGDIALAPDARRYAIVETGRAAVHIAPIPSRW